MTLLMLYFPKTGETVQTLSSSTVCNYDSFVTFAVTFAAAILKLDKYIRATKEQEMPSYLFVPPHLSQNSPKTVFSGTKTPSGWQLQPAVLTKVIVLDCRPQSIDVYPTKHTKRESLDVY